MRADNPVIAKPTECSVSPVLSRLLSSRPALKHLQLAGFIGPSLLALLLLALPASHGSTETSLPATALQQALEDITLADRLHETVRGDLYAGLLAWSVGNDEATAKARDDVQTHAQLIREALTRAAGNLAATPASAAADPLSALLDSNLAAIDQLIGPAANHPARIEITPFTETWQSTRAAFATLGASIEDLLGKAVMTGQPQGAAGTSWRWLAGTLAMLLASLGMLAFARGKVLDAQAREASAGQMAGVLAQLRATFAGSPANSPDPSKTAAGRGPVADDGIEPAERLEADARADGDDDELVKALLDDNAIGTAQSGANDLPDNKADEAMDAEANAQAHAAIDADADADALAAEPADDADQPIAATTAPAADDEVAAPLDMVIDDGDDAQAKDESGDVPRAHRKTGTSAQAPDSLADSLADSPADSPADLQSALDSLGRGIGETRIAAQTARELSHQARLVAGSSDERIANLLRTMSSISDRVGGLDTNLKTVEQAAFRANVLALNVEVEAARAGESGRSLALIGTEIKTLAQQTTEAVTAVRERLADTAAHAAESGDLADGVGRIMAELAETIEELDRQASAIDEAASGQEPPFETIGSGIDALNTQLREIGVADAARVRAIDELDRLLVDLREH